MPILRSTECSVSPTGRHKAFKRPVPTHTLLRYVRLQTKRCAYCKAVVHIDRKAIDGLHTVTFIVEETP